MSKQNVKKFKKNDYSYEEEDNYDNRSYYLEKKNQKRMEKALKTKDISILVENDEDDFDPYTIDDDWK